MKQIARSVQSVLSVTRNEASVIAGIGVVLCVGLLGSRLFPIEANRAEANRTEVLHMIDSLTQIPETSVTPESVESPVQSTTAKKLAREPVRTTPIVNINTASATALQTIPGIGPAMALRIIQARSRRAFTCADDLLDVPGIGEKKLAKMRPFVTAP